ncbi:MAG: hypothetical protein KKD44_28445, partial [Proteobacteria bacterium]|nr:hypothetical protein [Pseudomonadota bacterium]
MAVIKGMEVKLEKPASKKMMRWQLKMLVGEFLLLQQHSTDLSCPCELTTEHEFCQVKHLLAIERLAVETEPMTSDLGLKEKLRAISGAADDLSRAYQQAPEDNRPYDEITQFSRDARKQLEPYLWQYKQTLTLQQNRCSNSMEAVRVKQEPRWCFGVKSVDKQLGRFAKDLGMIQSKAKKLQKELVLPINICRGQVEMMQVTDPWGSRCRNPLTGQWASQEDCPSVPTDTFTIKGSELTWAISPVGLRRYDFVYRVYEANELIP